jgi:hypothetical protein
VFRLLDPEEMAQVFLRFVAALREGLGLDPAAGVAPSTASACGAAMSAAAATCRRSW